MNEQKFHRGDRVRIRPFSDIDASDLGEIELASDSCYCISRNFIDKASKEKEFTVSMHMRDMDAHTYRLIRDGDDYEYAFWWAQGMLMPAHEEYAELSEEDRNGLFDMLLLM